jgi:hypothetical protein
MVAKSNFLFSMYFSLIQIDPYTISFLRLKNVHIFWLLFIFNLYLIYAIELTSGNSKEPKLLDFISNRVNLKNDRHSVFIFSMSPDSAYEVKVGR